MFNRKMGDVVRFHDPFNGSGIIKGVATHQQPIVGTMWIVEVTSAADKDDLIPNEIYPFTHIVVADCWIEP